MQVDINTTGEATEPVIPATVDDAIEVIEETGELWQQQFSAALTVMREVVAEVRAGNQENSTLRQQVSELMQVNRDLTAQIAQTSQTQITLLESLTQQASEQLQRIQTPLTDASNPASLASVPETAAIETAAVIEETPAPSRPKRRAI